MNMQRAEAYIEKSTDYSQIKCSGVWILGHLAGVESEINNIIKNIPVSINVDMSEVVKIDIAGTLLIEKIISSSKKNNKKITVTGYSDDTEVLMKYIEDEVDFNYKSKRIKFPKFFYPIGKWIVRKIRNILNFFSFLGEGISSVQVIISHPGRIAWKSILTVFHSNLYLAMPIVALLNFIMGGVLCYQMLVQLEKYGIELFIVNIVGMIILREFGVVITSIIAAGRTSTSFSAQIGSMVLNDEINALRAMGLHPMALLVIPKIIGLVIALPLLTVWADIFGMLGAMVIAKLKAGISIFTFIERLGQVTPASDFTMGILKAPVFALLIALVGCYHGFNVRKTANSIGYQTTQSAVQTLFLIIVTDSLFSLIFSWKM